VEKPPQSPAAGGDDGYGFDDTGFESPTGSKLDKMISKDEFEDDFEESPPATPAATAPPAAEVASTEDA